MYLAPKLHEFFSKPQFLLQENILLLIDEVDLYLHPEWQRQILNDLLNAIKEAFPKNFVQVIITSHSPIILSDIPRGNSIFLQCQDGKIVQEKHEIQTFGANIYSLYKDAFFIKDGLAMGSFARETINSWIEEIKTGKQNVNCTPFVRQYDILNNKWGALLCRKEYQTNAIHQNSRSR